MDSSATISFLSEPADIGDLFSSYTYESPELNSVDDFKGCREAEDDDSEGTGNGEDIVGESEVQKEEDCLVSDVKDSSCMLLPEKCVESKNLTNKDTEPSCLLSFSSEAPDIKNLFSSYEYESPALDSIDEFRDSVYNIISDTEEREHISDARNESGLTPDVLLGCITSEKYDKSDGWLKCGSKSDLFTYSASNSEEPRINCENISAKHFASENETLDRNLEKRFSFDVSPILFSTNSGNPGSRSSKESDSSTEKFNAKHSPVDTNKPLSTGRLDSRNRMNNEHSVKVHSADNDKENYENEFVENGFVSTRKHKQNFSQRSHCPSSFSITSATDSTSSRGDATCRRKVLSETTNIQQGTVLETKGKWKCPQRSKPDLGPPLKQLRLEKWVHRTRFPS